MPFAPKLSSPPTAEELREYYQWLTRPQEMKSTPPPLPEGALTSDTSAPFPPVQTEAAGQGLSETSDEASDSERLSPDDEELPPPPLPPGIRSAEDLLALAAVLRRAFPNIGLDSPKSEGDSDQDLLDLADREDPLASSEEDCSLAAPSKLPTMPHLLNGLEDELDRYNVPIPISLACDARARNAIEGKGKEAVGNKGRLWTVWLLIGIGLLNTVLVLIAATLAPNRPHHSQAHNFNDGAGTASTGARASLDPSLPPTVTGNQTAPAGTDKTSNEKESVAASVVIPAAAAANIDKTSDEKESVAAAAARYREFRRLQPKEPELQQPPLQPLTPAKKEDPVRPMPNALHKANPRELVPGLYELHNVNLSDVPVARVLAAMGEHLNVPVRYDGSLLLLNDPHTTLVSFPQERTTYSVALEKTLPRVGMTFEVRVDESGKPFLWITASGTVIPNPGKLNMGSDPRSDYRANERNQTDEERMRSASEKYYANRAKKPE